MVGALKKQDSSESDLDSKPIKATAFKRHKGCSDLDSDSPSRVPMVDATTAALKKKKKQSPFYWDGSDDYRTKLDRLDQVQTLVKSKAWLSADVSALHSILLTAASDSSQQVKNKGLQLCEELWSRLATHNLASQRQLQAELKQSSQKSSALLAGLCQPLSCANSVVKLCYSESLHDQILDRVTVQQTLYTFVNLRDEWKDNISSQQIQLALCRMIKICCTLTCSCGQFRVSRDENWLVCEIVMQCPGACTVHLQLGENTKNVVGETKSLEVEVEKPTHLRFTEALELEQKVYPGDEWSVHFEVMSSLSKQWKCNFSDIAGYVRLTSGDSESISEHAVRVCSSNHEDQENNRFKITVRNNNMTVGLYSLFVSVQCAGEAVMVDTSPANFSAQCSRDPRKWSAKDVVTFVRQHIDISQSVLRSSDCKEVNGQELVDSGTFYLRDWLELAPSQSDFREKMQKIEALMKEIKSLDAEARFAEGPHKVLLEDCIMKRDLEIDTERIGAGGSSEVFKAVWKDKVVAVKMPPKGMRIDLALIKDLQLEMRRMQSCSHRNVVVCHGLMVEPCSPTSAGIVMELCSGTLLDLFVESKEPPWKKRLSAALDAARGLEYLHSRSIIHRDVKPQNLLIAAGGVIKVADFGLARRAELTATRLTSIVGTEGWMSPEQLKGHDGPPSDVWGLGCIIYFLITGQPPWPDTYTPAAIRTAILVNSVCPRAPSPLPNGCPAGFAQLCKTCCQFESAQRPKFNSIVQSIEKLVAGFPEDEGFQLPSNWRADGAGAAGTKEENALVELMPTDKDYEKVVAYLKLTMPTATVSRVEMHYNSALYRMYYWSRDKVARQNGKDGVGSSTEDQSNERWLWHGIRDTRAIAEVLKSGYQVQHASLDFNFYGAGNYFASDARLANWFAQGLRVRAQPPPRDGGGLQKRRLLLNRVACGRMYTKVSVLDSSFNNLGRGLNPSASQADASLVRSLLRRTEHRTAPSGFDSVVGNDPSREPGTEVIVFDNYLAFPACVVTYTLPDDLPNPYTQTRPYLKTLDQVPRDPFA